MNPNFPDGLLGQRLIFGFHMIAALTLKNEQTGRKVLYLRHKRHGFAAMRAG